MTFGGTAATGVTVEDSTEITATTPTNSAGAVDVVVTNPDGQSGRLSNGFTYDASFDVNGYWEGLTASGFGFRFHVEDLKIVHMSIEQIPIPDCGSFNWFMSCEIYGNTFSYTVQPNLGTLQGQVNGTFSSAATSSGNMNVTFSSSSCYAGLTINSAWTATKN